LLWENPVLFLNLPSKELFRRKKPVLLLNLPSKELFGLLEKGKLFKL